MEDEYFLLGLPNNSLLFNLFNLSTNSFNYPFTKQHFILYKQVTSQYYDPDVLHYVKLLVPEKIKKEIQIQLKTDISENVDHNSYSNCRSTCHNFSDIGDRKDDIRNVKDNSSSSSSSISLSTSFLNSLKELMIWFKKDFMRWVSKNPLCDNCGHHLTLEYIPGNTWELRGIENYYCSFCKAVFSFPRYGKIKDIADNRMGRCSEWTFLFGAILNSLFINTRIVHDFLDHCWNESFIGGRWVHIDSTLAYPISFNHSSYYEKNWNKEYIFVLAFSNSKLEDVTASYTMKWDQVLNRRSKLKHTHLDMFRKFYQKI
ncbi:MAG TPA: transglutaminase domain-containing protein [Candidatus Saccharimonadales bacterium]|nr:transglutaminase domain-containing protein [Candidatus Saccharimonadales bacterium]